MAESRNILVGAAQVWLTTVDSESGAGSAWDSTLSKATPTAAPPAEDFRNVGFTMEGVEVSYEPDFGDVEVDQLLDSARIFKQSMRVTVNTTFAEATLENLVIVWGQQNGTLTTTGTGENEVKTLEMTGGSLGDDPVERGILFVGKGPRTTGRKERVYHLRRAIQTESSSHALRRTEVTGLPVSFRVLPNAASSTAAYGQIIDRAVSAASSFVGSGA